MYVPSFSSSTVLQTHRSKFDKAVLTRNGSLTVAMMRPSTLVNSATFSSGLGWDGRFVTKDVLSDLSCLDPLRVLPAFSGPLAQPSYCD